MPPLKILITGGGGLLGQYLNIELSENHRILTLFHSNKGNAIKYPSAKIDLLNIESIIKIIQEYKPDVVIHNAAVSSASKADLLPPETVEKINVLSTQAIARECSRLGAKLIFTSTDLVYDGNQNGFIDENGILKPISVYAKTKMQAEETIKQTFSNYVILRVALLVGFGLGHSTNHFHFIFNQLESGKKVKLFYDQFRSPLEITNAVSLIKSLIYKDVSGVILNFGGSEKLSRLDVGKILCKLTGFNENLLIPVSLENSVLKYKVKDVSLNISKLTSMGVEPEPLENALKKVLKKH